MIKIKSRRNKILFATVFVLLAVYFMSPAAFALSGFDETAKGSVYIDLKHENTPIANARFTVYKVADAKLTGDDITYEYTREFANCTEDISSLSESDSPEKLFNYAKDNLIPGSNALTDANGHMEFTDLSVGIYLVAQTGAAQGYTLCSPFLAFIPYEEDGVLKYDSDATPKIDTGKVPDETTTVPPTVITTEPNTDEQLIQTGQLKWPVPVLAVAGIMLFGSGWCVYGKRKKE